jgi:TIGR03009 family protein
MRAFGWMILGALICGQAVQAQQKPESPTAPQGRDDDRLNAILWQLVQSFKGNRSLQVSDCTRIDKDRGGSKTWKGEIRFEKPNRLYMYLEQQEDKRFFECLVSTGSALYEYRPQFKKLVVHEMTPNGFGTRSSDLLSSMFGTTVDFRRRFDVTLKKDVSAANQHYIYIDIKPRSETDRRDFARAELVLAAKTMLPVRVWFEHPNGREVTWLLGNMTVNPTFNASAFAAPRLPEGWETVQERLPAPPAPQEDGKPRIIRQ